MGVTEGARRFWGVIGGVRGCCHIVASAMGFKGMLIGVEGFWGTTIGA